MKGDEELMEEYGFTGYDLSVRAIHVLMEARIHTPEQLADLTEIECLALKRCGKKTVNELRDVLRAEGLDFRRKVSVKNALRRYVNWEELGKQARRREGEVPEEGDPANRTVRDVLAEAHDALALRLIELMRECQR